MFHEKDGFHHISNAKPDLKRPPLVACRYSTSRSPIVSASSVVTDWQSIGLSYSGTGPQGIPRSSRRIGGVTALFTATMGVNVSKWSEIS